MTWETVKIGDLGKVITGNTPPKKNPEFYGDAYKFIKPTDMNIGERFTPETEEYYSLVAYEKYRKSLIPSKSTCVVTIGSIGKKMTMTNQECFVNQAVNAIIPNKNYNPFFVYYSIKNILPKVKKADTGASSGRENVSKSNFMSLTIKAPKCLQTQSQIANILCSYDDQIENNLKRINLLEQAAQNIYKEWFVNMRFPGHENTSIDRETGLPEGWKEKELSNLVSFLGGFAFKSKTYVNNGRFRVITIKNVGDKIFNTSVGNFVDEIPPKLKEHCFITEGDILLSLTGNVGRSCIAFGENNLLNQRVAKIKAVNNNWSPYIYWMFNDIKLFSLMNNLATGSAQQNLSPIKLAKQNVIIPDELIIDSYCEKVNSFFNQIILLNKSIIKLKSARDILLPRLMNQTIEV